MQPYSPEDAGIALAGTLFSVAVWDDVKPVSIARVEGYGIYGDVRAVKHLAEMRRVYGKKSTYLWKLKHGPDHRM